jgi:hypothetical protein
MTMKIIALNAFSDQWPHEFGAVRRNFKLPSLEQMNFPNADLCNHFFILTLKMYLIMLLLICNDGCAVNIASITIDPNVTAFDW